eukprot:c22225_g1_i1.p1 GENE.c22225_g1_i1~~c22225_g1_i1.p1  ORF type:complete len:187 (+),score=88.08 c22225_g1_i1:45-605(+)
MTKNVLIPIADGSEEIELVTPIDILRRAGANVTVASVGNLTITASRGTKIQADVLLSACLENTYDLIFLPGGMPGATNLKESQDLKNLLLKQKEEGRYFGAICASPAEVFVTHGLHVGKQITCHPGFVQKVPAESASRINERVVIDGNCITSRGPGTSLEASLALVEVLYGKEAMEKVKSPLVANF